MPEWSGNYPQECIGHEVYIIFAEWNEKNNPWIDWDYINCEKRKASVMKCCLTTKAPKSIQDLINKCLK